MNVSLTPQLVKFVENEVGSGLYQTASEVIRAGLRKLKDDKDRRSKVPGTLEELENEIAKGIAQLEQGKGIDGEEAYRRFQKKVKARVRA